MPQLKNPLQETGNEFIRQLDFFGEKTFNDIPFKGSWTPAQVGEHIRKSNKGMIKILTGPVQETERLPDEKIETIKNALLDFSLKMNSPDIIVPEIKVYTKQNLKEALQNLQNKLVDISENNDLTKTYVAFEMPGLGFLTGIEIINFVIFHTQRHTQQLLNMHDRLQHTTER